MKNKLTIAIDGPAASGKSTTARLLAQKLGYIYIDTGAMYRAATLAVLKKNIEPSDQKKVVEVIRNSTIELKIIAGIQHTYLDGNDVSNKIRTPQIDKAINDISTNADVRKIMVNYQRETAQQGGVVMDGRDIGTVVLPDADLKIFMKASIEARAQRRKKDHSAHNISLEEIKEEITRRDHSDMTRKESPLAKAKDARELDNSNLSIDQQVNIILGWIKEKL
jgi:cytidylate kinase